MGVILLSYRSLFLLILCAFHLNLSCQDLDIPTSQEVEVVVESCIGTGFFTELKRVIAALLEYDQKNLKQLTVD